MALLEAQRVTKYFGGLAAVAGVDCQVNQGEIVGLIGPNGAGKTTLFSLLAGSSPCTSGTIKFQNKNITKLNAHEICRRGLVRTFQAGNLFANMTVYENVLLAALFGIPERPDTAHAGKETTALLELVGLAGKEGFLAKDLTIAAQKRLEIARALATKPKLILLDEVMAGLNLKEVAESLELIRAIRESGVTIFMVEHVMKAIMGISERIVVLHHGEKIAEGTPEQIAASDTVIKVYLGE